ncbi:MAG: alpha/beta hydrolase, partial [Alphaproteobacteria bacterium]
SYCTPSKLGDYVAATQQGEPKVQKRAKDIEALIVDALAQGVPPEQIFVAGHSAGAWASLLVARRGQVKIGGYILFAPAFAGHYSARQPGWWDLQNRLAKYIGEAEQIDALVYAFENDKFNRVEDLRFLSRVKGVQFFALQSREVDGVACARQDGHETVYEECFRTTRNAEILNFILKRARATSPR